MAYHTPVYLLLFLPAVLLAYQITPQKKRWLLLLGASWIFFWSVSGKLLIFLIGTILFTHYIGLGLETLKSRCRLEAGKPEMTESRYRPCLRKDNAWCWRREFSGCWLCWLSEILQFFCPECDLLLEKAGRPALLSAKNLVLPLGISFYTLRAVGYMADVYWERTSAFVHPGKLALCLSFFPQLMEGPISSYSQTAEDLWKGSPIGAKTWRREPGDSVGTF